MHNVSGCINKHFGICVCAWARYQCKHASIPSFYWFLGRSRLVEAAATGLDFVSSGLPASNILPGFMSQSGSIARLMVCMRPMVSTPSSLTRLSFLPSPMPCSPVCSMLLRAPVSGKITYACALHIKSCLDHIVDSTFNFLSLLRILPVVHDRRVKVSITNMTKNACKQVKIIELSFCLVCFMSVAHLMPHVNITMTYQ